MQAENRERDVPFPDTEAIEQEIRAYCLALESNEEPPVPGEEGLHTQAVIDAIYESGCTGRRCVVKN